MCITRVWSLVRGGWKLGSFLLEIFPLAGGGHVVERDTTRDSCHVPEASILHVRMVWGTGAKMLGGFRPFRHRLLPLRIPVLGPHQKSCRGNPESRRISRQPHIRAHPSSSSVFLFLPTALLLLFMLFSLPLLPSSHILSPLSQSLSVTGLPSRSSGNQFGSLSQGGLLPLRFTQNHV